MSFCLKLLGGVSLEGEAGAISGPAAQRHRLALLALLAAAEHGASSRDKLMATLWPERDTTPARKLLNQCVHAIRKALGEDAILSSGDELRLNTERVWCDVAAFETALEAGEPARAVALYAGPFLDGFFLPDAPEFEQWVDQRRDRFSARYAAALEALAQAAAEQGDAPAAAEWWKARAAHDPYDSRVALRLAEALAASGNRAGALQHAAIHERLIAEEFGVAAPPELTALCERLRREPAAKTQPSSPDGSPPDRSSPASPAPVARAPTPAAAGTGVAEAGTAAPSKPWRVAGRQGWLRGMLVYGAVALLLAIVLVASSQLRSARSERSAAAARGAAIAVLPLANVSAEPADEALVDGMTGELIATIARIGGLRVIAGQSAFAFRNSQLDVRTIADSLNVSHVLEGDWQRFGSRLRVRVRLVGRDGTTRWSQTYDRDYQDVLAVQDDIARAVAAELGVRLSGATAPAARRLPTENVAAYELYLRGSDPLVLRSDSAAREGLEYFRQAIELDPTYAAAYAGLARMYLRLRMSSGLDSAEEMLGRAEAAALEAVALDDSLAEARAALGLVQEASYDFAAAEANYKRALALDPTHARVRELLVGIYIWTGRPAEALAEAERALRVDPLSATATAEYARALTANGRCDEALAVLEKVLALQPPLLRAPALAAHCYAHRQQWAEGIAVLRPQAERGERVALAISGYLHARAGEHDEAGRIRATLLDQWQRGRGGAIEIAVVHAGLGEFEQAVEWLERAVEERDITRRFLLSGPILDDLRGHPSFGRLRAGLGVQNR